MSEETGLVTIPKGGALELFTGKEGIDAILAGIKAKVAEHTPDTGTAKGRKEIASMAHKVSKSKVVLDTLGKDLVADWKSKAKQVDASRKIARDELDTLRDNVRQPLTDWESEQDRIAAEKKLAAELEAAHIEAAQENELFDLRAKVAVQEAEAERIRQEEAARIEAERVREERIANEKRIAEQAAAEATRLANEEAQRVSDQKESDRLAQIASDKAAAEKKAANKAHRRKINNEILPGLIDAISENYAGEICDSSMDQIAKDIIKFIVQGKIKHILVNY